jgi:hypothetical protein
MENHVDDYGKRMDADFNDRQYHSKGKKIEREAIKRLL